MSADSIVDAREAFVDALASDGITPALTRQHVAAFARHVLKTLNVCTRYNIQLCSSFIIKYVAASSARVEALGQYLIALSLDCRPEKPSRLTPNLIYRQVEVDAYEGLDLSNVQKVLSRPLPSHRRLHILYILHDVLISLARLSQPGHLAHAQGGIAAYGRLDVPSMLRNLSPHAIRHVHYVACKGFCDTDQAVDQLRTLLNEWRKFNILPGVDHLENLLDDTESRQLESAEQSFQTGQEEHIKKMREAHIDANKWFLPRRHGVKDDPKPMWYALPAANGLYMRRTRGYPMRYMAFPSGGYELRNGGKSTPSDIKDTVQWLYNEALHAFDKHPDHASIADVDTLGNIVWVDSSRPSRNHWGRTREGVLRERAIEARCREFATGYADIPDPARRGPPNAAMGDALARARALAAQNRGANGGFGDAGSQGREYSQRNGAYGDDARGFDRGFDESRGSGREYERSGRDRESSYEDTGRDRGGPGNSYRGGGTRGRGGRGGGWHNGTRPY